VDWNNLHLWGYGLPGRHASAGTDEIGSPQAVSKVIYPDFSVNGGPAEASMFESGAVRRPGILHEKKV
jgi:hypothetical protein